MDEFDLILNPVSTIDENGVASLTGKITGLDVPGGEVTLDIDWGDPLSPQQNQSITLKDDGTGGDQVAGDGIIEFSIGKQYLDDNPTGTPFDTYTINVAAEENFLIGTDAVFVIDVSGSTSSEAQGISVGDLNGDGNSNTILDAEIAAFKSLNQDLIDRGLGNTAKVSISAYDSSAFLLDLDPVAAGVQTFTTPLADTDNNGILDVEQALMSLQSGGFTNFEAGLQKAIDAVNAAGTGAGDGNVIFLSDGFVNRGDSFNDEVNTLRNTLGQNLRAFGVGSGSSLSELQQIDPNAEKFTDVQELLDLFAGTGAGTNQDSESTDVTVENVAPVVTIDDITSMIDENGVVTLTGNFSDVGTLDTHTGTVDWGDGTIETLTLNEDGTFSASHQYLDDGPFGSTPQNGTPSDDYTISVSVLDDDTGVGTATATTTVKNVAPELSPLSDNLPGLGIIVEGDTLELSASYTDVGTKDFHTIDFDWGDGSPIDTETQDPLLGGVGNASGSHVYNAEGVYTATLTVTDDDTLSDEDSVDVIVAKKVDIDWKPGSNPSAMNFKGGGNIPVAILGTADFDVTGIDLTTLKADDEKDPLLNGGGANAITSKSSLEDTNNDGFLDLVVFFEKSELGSVVNANSDPFLSDNQIYLFGENSLLDSGYFFGMQQVGDPIKIVG